MASPVVGGCLARAADDNRASKTVAKNEIIRMEASTPIRDQDVPSSPKVNLIFPANLSREACLSREDRPHDAAAYMSLSIRAWRLVFWGHEGRWVHVGSSFRPVLDLLATKCLIS